MRHATTSFVTMLAVLLAAALPGCGSKQKPEAEGDRFAGLWRVKTEFGTSELTLERQGERYLLRSEGTEAVASPSGANALQGDVPHPLGVLRFVFERTGPHLRARYTVHVPGKPEEALPEVLYDRVAPPGAGSGGPGGGSTSPTLVGHWQHTEALSSGGVSLVTDTNLVLREDGTASTWTRTEGVTSANEPQTPGRWKTEGGKLLLHADGGSGWMDLGSYVQDGDRLMLVRPNGDKQVFQRR